MKGGRSSSLQLTWKDRFLICIGWTDPAKLEEKLRAQMAENMIEKGEREKKLEDNEQQQTLVLNGNRRKRKEEGKQLTCKQKQPIVVLEEVSVFLIDVFFLLIVIFIWYN